MNAYRSAGAIYTVMKSLLASDTTFASSTITREKSNRRCMFIVLSPNIVQNNDSTIYVRIETNTTRVNKDHLSSI